MVLAGIGTPSRYRGILPVAAGPAQ